MVESRTKKYDSIDDKIKRKNIQNFREEILDITGIRIILYYQDDLDSVEQLINRNFNVDNENSVNKENLFESNEFGYLSRHYIVQLTEERTKLPEWTKFSNLKAEIQVRTVLQHSWASISHELTYKKKYDIPKELSRKLFRLAGLFELADEQFLEIRNEHLNLKSEIDELTVEEISNESINQLTLDRNINLSESLFEEISNSALETGFKLSDEPRNNSYSGIKLVSDILNLQSIGQIEVLLRKHQKEINQLFKLLIKKPDEKRLGTWYGDKSFFILLAVLINLDGDQLNRFSQEYGWNNDIWDRTFQAILEVKKNTSNKQ